MIKAIDNLQDFEIAIKAIKTKMDDGIPFGSDLVPVYDGPVDDEKYFNQPIKIAWILKEAYGEGDWDYNQYFKEQPNIHQFISVNPSRQTWQRIAFVSYSILNSFPIYNDMSDWKEDPEIANSIFQVALVNTKKIPGASRSNDEEIKEAFENNKDLLKEQLELLNPDIIIGGGTLHLYKELFDLKEPSGHTENFGRPYFINHGKLFIDAYHPAYACDAFHYHDDIILTARSWHQNQMEQLAK